MRIGFARIRTKLLTHSLLLSLIPLAIVGYLAYRQGEQALREKTFNHLMTTAILKEAQIKGWLGEKERDIRLLATLPSILDDVAQLQGRLEEFEAIKTRSRLQMTLKVATASHPDFQEIFVLEPNRGKVILSTDPDQEGKFKSDRPYFRMGKHAPFVQNIYYSIALGRPTLTIASPILDHYGKRLGVLVGRVSLSRLDEIMAERTGLGHTGETFLVNKFNFFVSEALGRTDMPERKGVFTEGVKAALRGENGTGLYLNHRGVPVVGAYRWLPKRELALIAEMAQAEAFAPIDTLRRITLMVGGVVILLLVFAVARLTRSLTRPIQELVAGAQAIGGGELDHRIEMASRDELGYLAQAFNRMGESLKASHAQLEEYSRTLEEKVRGRTRELATLFETARNATSTLNLEEMLPMILKSAVDLLNCHAGTIRLIDQERKILRLAADYNLSQEFKERLDIPLGEGVVGRAILEDRPAVVEDLEKDERFINKELALREGIRSLLAVPLHHGGAVIGVLNVYSREPRRYTTEEIATLSEFANLATLAVEKARHYETAKSRASRLEALSHLGQTVTSTLEPREVFDSVVRAAVDLLQIALARIWIFDEASGELQIAASHGDPDLLSYPWRSFRPGEGMVGLTFQRGEVICVDDVQEDPRYFHKAWAREVGLTSLVGIPLILGERTLGVLTGSRREPHPFTSEELELLTSFASYAAIAIENARLYHEVMDYSMNLEERVRERTQELEIANQHKSEFLATMSHELRTPLNAVIGFSQLLTDQLGSSVSERHRRYLNNIEVSGHHLLNLINGILDLAKVESGRMDLQYEEIPLPELIQQAIAGVQPQADAKALTLSSEVQEGLDRVTLDAGKVKQILYNLLGNAVKFTPDGGQVRITARAVHGSGFIVHGKELSSHEPSTMNYEPHGNFLEISVSDTGIGIKPEDQGRLFQPFQQIDSSLARKYPGTGLGLALTKKMVDLHGGRIWVESEMGKGSTFTFTLALKGLKSEVQGPKSEAVECPPPDVGPGTLDDQDEAKPLILVVEDDPKAIDLLSTYLREGGYRVAVARSGQEALAKTRALRPLAVTLDILFPTEDGWQILQDLKTDPETREIPVLIVSILNERLQGLQMGATEYLVKPVTKEALLNGLVRLGIALPRLERMQVLAIDDDPAILELIQAILHDQDLSLLTARNGPEGIRLAQMKKPDLIILDLMMPGMTGFEVVQRLRADPVTSEIPIMICSAKTLTAPERELLVRQVEWIIQKGNFLPKDLLQMIAEVRDRQKPTP